MGLWGLSIAMFGRIDITLGMKYKPRSAVFVSEVMARKPSFRRFAK